MLRPSNKQKQASEHSGTREKTSTQEDLDSVDSALRPSLCRLGPGSLLRHVWHVTVGKLLGHQVEKEVNLNLNLNLWVQAELEVQAEAWAENGVEVGVEDEG